jgi:cytoskeletal protein RodZ
MSLGDFLRSARENAGLSVDDLAERTSIRAGLIKEMENNKFIHCGGDTYARGHLRNIAPLISTNAQVLIDLYNEEHSTDSRKIHEMLVENNVTKLPTERKTISWKSLAVASIVILVALAVGQIVISNSKSTITPTDVATPTVSVTPSAQPSVTPTASPSVSKSSSVTSPAVSGEVALSISAARGNAKIDVVVDGTHVYKGPIFQGDVKSFTGVTAISIYLSNAGDLDLTLNGQTLAPLGARNEEIRKTFRSK